MNILGGGKLGGVSWVSLSSTGEGSGEAYGREAMDCEEKDICSRCEDSRDIVMK